MRPVAAVLAALLAAAPGPASAARVGFQAGAGASFPAGAVNGALTSGGALTAGLSLELSRRAGVTLDYLYAGNSVDRDVFANTDLTGLHAMHVLGLGGRWVFLEPGPVLLHLIVAPGLYYRRVSIDEVVGTAVGNYCDPWLFYCVPTAVPITEAKGSRDRTDFGLAAGLGVAARAGPVKPYLELRIHRIFGGTVTDAQGRERSTSATFIPVLLGFRY